MNTINDVIKKYNLGIDPVAMKKDFEFLLPKIEEIGWWGAKGATHQFQIAIQARENSPDPYHECCGPQPNLNKNDDSNPLTEGSFNQVNDLFKGSEFERLISLFPIEITRTRILKLRNKSAYRLHRDMTYKFHIPIVTTPSNLFIFPEQQHRHIIHLPADGTVYFTDTSVCHTFMNGGITDRYHVVLSSTLDREILLDGFPEELDLTREHYPSLDKDGEWI